MATIKYDIKYEDGKTVVTRDVVAVDKGDKIIFKSNYAKTGIRYQGQSPFTGSKGPQADQVVEVGKSAGPFAVNVPSNGKPRKFKCGEYVINTPGPGAAIPILKSWKGGNDTP